MGIPPRDVIEIYNKNLISTTLGKELLAGTIKKLACTVFARNDLDGLFYIHIKWHTKPNTQSNCSVFNVNRILNHRDVIILSEIFNLIAYNHLRILLFSMFPYSFLTTGKKQRALHLPISYILRQDYNCLFNIRFSRHNPHQG